MTIILGLDLATTTGWAHGDGTALPTVGHVKLPAVEDGARGAKFSAFRRWFVAKVDEVRPDIVIFEAPILPKPFIKTAPGKRPFLVFPTNISVTTVLQGLAAIVELECEDRDIACKETNVSEVKKQLTGNGAADKDDMVRAARRMGLKIAVHDEADGAAVWLVGVRYYAKEHLHRFDRLLWGAKT